MKISKRMRLERNKRSFQRMKVDYYKYIKDFYLEDGLAYISCNVTDYYDIIDPYSVEGYEWLRKEFTDFVESNAFYIPIEYPIVLEICGCRFREKDRKVIRETIGDYYELKLGDKQMELRDNMHKGITFLLIGVLFTVLFFLAEHYYSDLMFNELLLIFVWFFVWELSDLLLFDRRDLKEEKMAAAQLAKMKINFKLKFKDEPVGEEEKNKIYQMLEEASDAS